MAKEERRYLSRAVVAALVMVSLINLVFESGQSGVRRALDRSADGSLESIVLTDPFLTHDLYYIYTVLRKEARGATLVVYDLEEVRREYLYDTALRFLGGVVSAETEYEPSAAVTIDPSRPTISYAGQFRRNPNAEELTFVATFLDDGLPASEVQLFLSDGMPLLIDLGLEPSW